MIVLYAKTSKDKHCLLTALTNQTICGTPNISRKAKTITASFTANLLIASIQKSPKSTRPYDGTPPRPPSPIAIFEPLSAASFHSATASFQFQFITYFTECSRRQVPRKHAAIGAAQPIADGFTACSNRPRCFRPFAVAPKDHRRSAGSVASPMSASSQVMRFGESEDGPRRSECRRTDGA